MKFDYKQPDIYQVKDMESLNETLYELLEKTNVLVPSGRHRELAIQKLEEFAMWAKKGITHGN